MVNSDIVTRRQVFSARELCVTAVMTALVFLATFVPRIPIPLGYAHLGDAVIFLLALLLGRREALIAACLGSALSDVMGGFFPWVVPTLFIKFWMAEIVWHLAGRTPAGLARTAAAFLLSSLWMAAAYAAAAACLRRTAETGSAGHGARSVISFPFVPSTAPWRPFLLPWLCRRASSAARSARSRRPC